MLCYYVRNDGMEWKGIIEKINSVLFYLHVNVLSIAPILYLKDLSFHPDTFFFLLLIDQIKKIHVQVYRCIEDTAIITITNPK
mgnify:CR=1 FL=1